ncbi:MAG: ATP-binding cassette domain-containing protein, partial [Cloacibacillus porcorum]|nr:ATP-binding cassette domain-containing protein [Cloacibacillus porcorum]
MTQERQFILKGAEFCYPNASEKILKGIDLEIRAGEWVALLGSSGSGRATRLRLLGALLLPTQGRYFGEG